MISLIIPAEDGKVLTVSQNGYGKRTEVTEFPTKGRGTQGVIAMQCSDRNGDLVGAVRIYLRVVVSYVFERPDGRFRTEDTHRLILADGPNGMRVVGSWQ